MAVIKGCSCKHDYQDQVYGKGQRVHNEGKALITCSVCGTKKK